MIQPFLTRLAEGPILGDGAMGTMLYAEGVPFQRCFEELNLTRPTLVQEMHRAYIEAGAELITTNTFGANRFRLTPHGLTERVREINLRGAKLAREAREIVGEAAFVVGSIGPIGRGLRPIGDLTLDDARSAFQEQVEALLEGGVDVLLFETFSRLDELLTAVTAARDVCDLPIIAQMSFAEDGFPLDGTDPAEVARALQAVGASVVGANCGVGPQGALEAIERMASATSLPLSAAPNAGLPSRVDGRFLYFSTPDYFADYGRRFVAAGTTIVGGCCGTTPRHILAMRDAVRTERRRTAEAKPAPARVQIVQEQDTQPAPSAPPTQLAAKFAAGKFVVSVELDPPKGITPTKILAGAEMLKNVGVDLFNVADSPMARVRMSCLGAARLIHERTGLETIIHFTTRDRNLMALQSELIGAHATGIRNVLALTGDPPRLGDYPNATGVWDVDSIGLIGILKGLNQGHDWSGNSIGRPASFFVGCAVNPTAEDLDKELERFARKIEAGADFVMSQPLYDLEQLERFLDRVGTISIPLLLGIMPVQSSRHAEFLHNEVPGISIPERLRERMRQAGENGMAEGIAQAQEFLTLAKRYVQGVYFMPSFGRYEMVAELVKAI